MLEAGIVGVSHLEGVDLRRSFGFLTGIPLAADRDTPARHEFFIAVIGDTLEIGVSTPLPTIELNSRNPGEITAIRNNVWKMNDA